MLICFLFSRMLLSGDTQVQLSVSYQFHELDIDQIICIQLRMDLGYKNLSLSVLSSVPLSFRVKL